MYLSLFCFTQKTKLASSEKPSWGEFNKLLYCIVKYASQGPVAGTGGAGGAVAPVALYQEGQGGQRCSFEFFYEFASENARNAIIELQE